MGKQLELCERAGQSWAEKLWESMPKEIREEVVRAAVEGSGKDDQGNHGGGGS